MSKASAIRFLYSLLFYLALPWIIASKLWRARLAPAYAKRWDERLAWHRIAPQSRQGLWLHAVSLGEVNAALPLIKALLARYPDLPLTLTTTTPTGSKRIQQVLGQRVFHQYLPFDLPGMMARFLNRLQPKLAIIMESELWPNLYHQCQRRNIPMLLANARLSPQSALGYRRLPGLTQTMLSAVTHIAAQTELDADRYRNLTDQPDRVQVAGNLKFNVAIPDEAHAQGRNLRSQLGDRALIWIAASTHPGEEQQIYAAHKLILDQCPDSVLILVPRHPERFKQVVSDVSNAGFVFCQRSHNNSDTQCQIFIGDSMGEMMIFYGAADIAFVGGSLVAVGGHNPLEPIAMGLPTLMGPQTYNLKAQADALYQAQAMWQIDDGPSLAQHILQLYHEPAIKQQLTDNANAFLKQHQQALSNHMQWVERLIK